MVKKFTFQTVIGKCFYGSLFVILVPAFLFLWATMLQHSIKWNVPYFPVLAISMIAFALFLMLKGMLDLFILGRGLPMNAYPPQQLVMQGVYAWFPHPIYLGAILLTAGTSLWFRSSSGLYIVTPTLILMIFSFFYGYELLAMKKLFGEAMQSYQPLFSLPHASEERSLWIKKWAMLLRVFLPWLVIRYFIDYARCTSCNSGFLYVLSILHWWDAWPLIWMAPSLYVSSIPHWWGVWPLIWMAPSLYMSSIHHWWDAWPLIWMAPFLYLMIQILAARTNSKLSHVVIGSTLATGLFLYLYSFLPVLAIPFLDSHWRLILASLLSLILATNYHALWFKLQDISEKVANSRHDWLFADGRFRIINHSVYSGLAGAVGTAIASYILGNNLAVLLLTVCVLVGAAVFAQSLWGSHALLRPFGYWGAILGGVIGIGLISFFFGISLSTIALAGVLAAPFVQAIGRMRCLVQGCCHGIITKKPFGIRVWHPQSRVVALSGLKGEYLMNTQLYSILFNILLGLFLWSMWLSRNVSSSFIIGQYIILTGIERFAEDAYRGEKQTRIRRGLRENQWIAIGAFMSGAMITILPSTIPSNGVGPFDLTFLATVLVGGLLTAFAMSMDFPKSQVRFSRLSG